MAYSFLNIFRRREAAPTPLNGVPGVPSSSVEAGPEVKGGTFQERIVYARSPQTALTVSAVYRATELRATTMAVMPVQFRKKDYANGNFTEDMRGFGRRLNYLLQQEPNPITTASSLWEQVTINRIMWGNGFVYIERDDMGFPMNLWLVDFGSYDIANGTYNIGYLSDIGYVEKVNVPREDVLHFPNTFRFHNGFWGISTIQYAAETLGIIKTQKAQLLETAAKGGRMKLIIGEDTSKTVSPISAGLFDRKEMEKYADEVNDRIYTKDVVALRALDKVQNISMSAQDMQLLEQMNLGLDDVARFWAVPRPLLMLDTNSHYNDYQNATMEFHTRTILPDKTKMEKEIARKLIGFKEYGYRDIHICEDPLLAMDPERQAKVDQLLLQNGTKTPNEIRQKHDMPAVENGDEPLASANLLTLKALIAKSEAATTLAPGNYTVAQPSTEGENGEQAQS
jgi:HK97 family phage portal protein